MAKKEVKKDNQAKNSYFKDMKAELKKVIWPTPKQLVSNTAAEIVFTVIIAVIVFVLDLCFDSLHKNAVTPLQEKIQTSYSEKHKEENTTSNETSNDENNTDTTDSKNTESNTTNTETENTVENSENTENQQ